MVRFDLGVQRALELQFNSINQLPNWAFSFDAGMTGAWAYVRITERYERAAVERMAIRALVPAALVFALFVYLAGRETIGSDLPNLDVRKSSFLSIGYTASLAAVMLSLALAPRRLQTPVAHPLVRKLGDISYGVYLIQAPISGSSSSTRICPRTAACGRSAVDPGGDTRVAPVRLSLGPAAGAADPPLGAPLRAPAQSAETPSSGAGARA